MDRSEQWDTLTWHHDSNYSRSTCCHHRDRCNRVSRRRTSSYTKCHTDASQTWDFADNLNFTVSMCLLKGEKTLHACIYIYIYIQCDHFSRICDWKLLRATMKKYLGAPVRLTRSAYCACAEGALRFLTYLRVFAALSNTSQTYSLIITKKM